MVFENLMALYIAIEKQCTVEVAFKWLERYLENGEKVYKGKPHFDWTHEDLQDVIKLKEQGLTYNEIGSYYDTNGKNLSRILYAKGARINYAK